MENLKSTHTDDYSKQYNYIVYSDDEDGSIKKVAKFENENLSLTELICSSDLSYCLRFKIQNKYIKQVLNNSPYKRLWISDTCNCDKIIVDYGNHSYFIYIFEEESLNEALKHYTLGDLCSI